MSGLDEFAWIARLRGLTRGDPAALDLLDDAAVLPSRAGQDLVITKDAMVEGVHFLADEAGDVVARRLLRTNLSDLAAKAAEPFGYALMTAFPPSKDGVWREAFARGLGEDGERYGIALLGGDTVSTPGPVAVSATVFGWVPAGRAVLRSGARAGDQLLVAGFIGDGLLGLRAAQGLIDDPSGRLAAHYRLPEPRLDLRADLRAHAHACADVSDGLLADALHIARASGLGVHVGLDRLPLSPDASAWLRRETDVLAARLELATGGDDYALAIAAEGAFPGTIATGDFFEGEGLRVTFHGEPVDPGVLGWRHG